MCHPLYLYYCSSCNKLCLNGLDYQLNSCSNHSFDVRYSSSFATVVFTVKGPNLLPAEAPSIKRYNRFKRTNNLTLTCKGVSKIDKDSAMHSTIWRRTRKCKHFIHIAKKGTFCPNGLKSGSLRGIFFRNWSYILTKRSIPDPKYDENFDPWLRFWC